MEKTTPAVVSAVSEPVGAFDSIDLVLVRLPFIAPFGTSVAFWANREALLLRLEQEGVSGWGECVADIDPYYDSETNDTERHIIRDFLLPEVTAERSVDDIMGRLRRVRGHPMAKAALENALLDLIARRHAVNLTRKTTNSNSHKPRIARIPRIFCICIQVKSVQSVVDFP